MPICARLLISRFRPGVRDTGQSGLYLAVGLGITMLLLAIAMQLPQAPYNLRELFGEKSLWMSLPLLSAYILWSATAPNLVARVTIICPALHLFQPILFILVAAPAWLLLWISVSSESLVDVLGEPVLGWAPGWEAFARYLALAFPVFLSLFCWNLLFEGNAWIGRRFGAGQLLAALLMGVPLLWLSKYVVVDLAATDRVIMLSAHGPSWQVGGALSISVAMLTLNGVILAWMAVWPPKRRLLVAAMTPLLLAGSWWFLRQGLSPEGVTLLLGTQYSEEPAAPHQIESFIRWALAYAGSIAVIAFTHLIPFRLRGSPMSQREAYARGSLHHAVSMAPGGVEQAPSASGSS